MESMKQDVIAPWAEVVLGALYPMTIAQMQALPDDNWLYELVDGRLVRMPGSGNKASAIAANLIIALGTFVRPRKLGRVTGADGEYDLTPAGATLETALIPDVAFVRAGRLPAMGTKAADRIPHLAPDLVAEIASPSQSRPAMADKARMYLAAGVRLVWIIWPDAEQVDVWHAGSDVPIATLSAADSLDGLDVLSGFTHPVADLFVD
jgi:Uma2 family endonuclease